MIDEEAETRRTAKGHLYARVPELYTNVDPLDLDWPRDREGASGNREYEDFSNVTWADVDEVLAAEAALLKDTARQHPDSPLVDLFDEVDPIDFAELGLPFDFGVCSATLALNAAGCPTTTSCAGHFDGYPDIVFWTRPGWVSHLVAAASAAKVGIGNALHGTVEVFTQPEDVMGLVRFARELRARADEFDAISRAPRQIKPNPRNLEKAAKKKRKDQKRARQRQRR